jgi:hypothetical protein
MDLHRVRQWLLMYANEFNAPCVTRVGHAEFCRRHTKDADSRAPVPLPSPRQRKAKKMVRTLSWFSGAVVAALLVAPSVAQEELGAPVPADPDVGQGMDLVTERGYPLEKHYVTTEDGTPHSCSESSDDNRGENH